MIAPLDVIWIWDTRTNPAKKKMVVCICPEDGLFYRINSHDDFPIGVSLPREPNHVFLEWDSYLECGKYPIELDEFQIEQSLRNHGGKPIGRVAIQHAAEIFQAVQLQSTISKEVKRLIQNALQS